MNISLRLAVIGYGGVGRAFVKLIEDKKDALAAAGLIFELKYIIDKENRADFDAMLCKRDVDMAVIATPTNRHSGEPGYSYIKNALQNGLHVVTADKGPILLAYDELREIAAKHNVQLGIGCTTGGALPAINGGLIDLAGAKILSIEGVLNGASNFILDEMRKKNRSYQEALADAQKLGITETDPTLDVEGWDTAIKLLILVNVLLGQRKTLADIKVCGITAISAADIARAARRGQKYRLLGQAAYLNGELMMEVAPRALGPEHPFYMADGKNKAVRYISDTMGDLIIMGGASGLIPAAASLLRDIVNIYSRPAK
ncbi:MAG: homoserine dehydrogenase [Clostridiales bacterium]|nr:homoserine dehydrogenase [Clostridiales bacterium]